MRKKTYAILTALLLAAAPLAGCSSQQQEAPPPESGSQSGASQASGSDLEPVTVTVRNVFSGTNAETRGTPVGDVYYEKTGVNVKLEYSVGDENQTIALMIASGDLPDMVIPHYNVAPFVEAGCALELTDLIE